MGCEACVQICVCSVSRGDGCLLPRDDDGQSVFDIVSLGCVAVSLSVVTLTKLAKHHNMWVKPPATGSASSGRGRPS